MAALRMGAKASKQHKNAGGDVKKTSEMVSQESGSMV